MAFYPKSVSRLLAVVVLALAGLATSCGRTPEPNVRPLVTGQALDPAQYRAPGIPARFGDRDPHDWSGLSPDRYAVHGLDAARYQGRIDWAEARRAGIRFAWLKATEGGDVLDPGLAENSGPARRAGVPVGAYHFYYFCRSAREQADWFIANVPRRAGDLPPLLDMEWNHTSPTCRLRPEASVVRAEIQTFAQIVARHYGTAPVIYTTPDFYRENDLGRLRGFDFWLRSVTAHPSERYPEERWTFWQYSGTGVVPGVNGIVDLNAFAGSETDWQRWLSARSQR
ncbi:glycoside hydrolase family 25 protein [Pseudooceanicola sp. C21-150M6]|uniref:glycoside hydrolase family 25 protein n=1 Tax=Pseudooceanicola sp. C21-150M6 TaxID=3434355 RepID=UPI003D7FCBCB